MWDGLIVETPDGVRYYRHISRDLNHHEYQLAVSETLRFAGDGSWVVTIRECTNDEHLSGIANCKFGH